MDFEFAQNVWKKAPFRLETNRRIRDSERPASIIHCRTILVANSDQAEEKTLLRSLFQAAAVAIFIDVFSDRLAGSRRADTKSCVHPFVIPSNFEK